ncbi:MAG: antirestriction protein ArdA [Sphingopyxis sp.]|nr:MAG: antirestriction protein ArdA [Sphingopyxis sp.]
MTTFFAQPYNIDATGFYFTDLDEYLERSKNHQDRYGQMVEEYEIQFIDGEHIDCTLASAFGVNQANLNRFFDLVDDWDDDQKTRYIIAVGEGGYAHDCDPDDLDIDIYEMDSLKELAEQFVEEGLFGDIPEKLRFYLDMELIARDLGMDYSEIEIAGRRFVYRCG